MFTKFHLRSALVMAATLLALCGSARTVAAQTLGDLAKQEEQRRKDIKKPAKVWTNDDLKAAPPPSGPPVDSAKPGDADSGAAGAGDAGAKGAAKPDDKGGSSDAGKQSQAIWAGRMKKLQEQLEKDQTFLDALQSRVNALTTDFVNRDDPAQKAQIEKDRQRAIAELDNLKQTIAADKKAISDLEEEARRAGVPPGWLRS
jgi:hypothetical protein